MWAGHAAVTDRLEPVRVGARAEAVVERLEGDALLVSLRLAHSWPLMHRRPVYGKYELNFRKNGPKSRSTT